MTAVGDRGRPRWSRTSPRYAWALTAAPLPRFCSIVVFRGQWTLPHNDDAHLVPDAQRAPRVRRRQPHSIPLITPIRQGVGGLVDVFIGGLHALSWPGLVAVGGCDSAWPSVAGGWRSSARPGSSRSACSACGSRAIDTLGLTLAAVVLSLAIGIPLGILAGRNDRFLRIVTPVLDVMQIMPTFAYLAPLALLFLIGPATAAIATMIYAIPPAIRITALGIRGVSAQTVEAATSLGSTRLPGPRQGPAPDGPARRSASASTRRS